MRTLRALLLTLIISTVVHAATDEEVRVWKHAFPRVEVEASFGLRRLVSSYEGDVLEANGANLSSVIRRLRQRAEADLSEAIRTSNGKGPTAKEAREKIQWISHRFYPFLGKIG
jgi:hypothetical protein